MPTNLDLVDTSKLVEARELVVLTRDLRDAAGEYLRRALAPVVSDLVCKLGIEVVDFEDEVFHDSDGTHVTSSYEWTVTNTEFGDHQFLSFNDGANWYGILAQLCEFQVGELTTDIDCWASVGRGDISPAAQSLYDSLLINQLEPEARDAAYWALSNWYVAVGKNSAEESWYWHSERGSL